MGNEKRFNYLTLANTVGLNKEWSDLMNALGMCAWELIHISNNERHPHYLFKREIYPDENHEYITHVAKELCKEAFVNMGFKVNG